MKKITLILAALFMASYAVGADCDQTATLVPPGEDEFALVLNSKGVPAVQAVGFCEDSDYVIDTFILAKSAVDHLIHLYVHELIAKNKAKGAPAETVVWFRFGEDLSGCTNLLDAQPSGPCGQPGDFTRSVGTGSGLGGPGKATSQCGIYYSLCGHSKEIKYGTSKLPPNQ